MIHERHFTPEEANALLRSLATLLLELREAKEALTDAEAHELLGAAAGSNGGGAPGKQVGEAFLHVRGLLATLEEAGVVLRDIDRGLVDFPTLLDGREVYLCWQLGEENVAFWHDLDSGFRNREPLE